MIKLQPKTVDIGKKTIFVPSCHSTNDLAAEIIQNDREFSGTVILTDFQTAGRGQRNSQWQSSAGENLLCSICLDPVHYQVPHIFDYVKITGLSIIKSLNEFGVNDAKLKWPNDIILNDKKIGGILIENKWAGNVLKSIVVGIGINVNQTNFENPHASSLLNQNITLDRLLLLEKICEKLENIFFESIKKENTLEQDYMGILWRFDIPAPFLIDGIGKKGIIKTVKPSGEIGILVDGILSFFDLKEVQFVY